MRIVAWTTADGEAFCADHPPERGHPVFETDEGAEETEASCGECLAERVAEVERLRGEATTACARHIFWMLTCTLLEEEGVGYPSGDAEFWLSPPPRITDRVSALVVRLGLVPKQDAVRWGCDLAHWLLGSGGASGHHDEPANLPSWEDLGLYLGDDGLVYLDSNVPLGDIPTLTGQEWLTSGDFASLRAELVEIWPTGDEGETDGPVEVMTSLGYVTLHPDGDVVQYGKVIHTVTLPD